MSAIGTKRTSQPNRSMSAIGGKADSGVVTHRSWDAVTISWNNGHVAVVHHGDMREILQTKVELIRQSKDS